MLDDRYMAVLNRIAEALEALVPYMETMTAATRKIADPTLQLDKEGKIAQPK